MKGKRSWAIPIALVVAVLVAAGCGSRATNSMSCRRGLDHERRRDDEPAVLAADEINTSNVAKLKGVWRTHLNGVAMAAKYSGESQPIVYNGVIYVTPATTTCSPSRSRAARSSGSTRRTSTRRSRRSAAAG